MGVELDPEVVRAARTWFDLDELGLEIVCGDAREFLERSRRRFDAVLEDVFVGSGRAVKKPGWLPVPGLARARRRVAPGGILATNALDDAGCAARELGRLFPAAVRIEVEGYDNRILVGGSGGLSGSTLRRRVATEPLYAPSLPELGFRSIPR